jgi:phage terminase small subunit
MNTAHQLFVDEWVRSQDRLKALTAAGYQTANRQTAMVQFRRLMQREEVRAAIKTAKDAKSPQEMDEIDRAIAVCWDTIDGDTAQARDKSALLGVLTKLRGWDKVTKVEEDVKPPTFQFMPFSPADSTSTVPE